MRRLLLASESPRRRELLGALGIPFETVTAQVEELKCAASPEEVPLVNALLKADAVAARHPDALIIGADTVILFQGEAIGKPHDLADAERLLLSLAGHSHQVVTGLALVCRAAGFRRNWLERSEVVFKPFDRAVAKRYLELVPVLDKAGAYAIQQHGDLLIDHISGDLNNIIGLPLEQLRRELSAASAL